MTKCQIICEVGASHHGNMKRAIKLIDAAKATGADFVKFQIWLDLNKFVSKTSKYYTLFNEWKMSESQWIELYNYSLNQGIPFVASAFDNKAVDLLCELGVPFLKIASGDITYLPFIEYVASKGLPVMLSTGMATGKEILQASTIIKGKKVSVIPMICTVNYPCKLEDVNLWRAGAIKSAFPTWGFSDHTKGELASVVAVSLGASYIEKHMDMADGHDVCGWRTFKNMVQKVREAEKIIGGSKEFDPLECEKEIIATARRNERTWLRE